LHPAGLSQHVCPAEHAEPPLHEHLSLPPIRAHASPALHVAPLQLQRPVEPLHEPPELPVRHRWLVVQPHVFAGLPPPPQTNPPLAPCCVQSLPQPPQLVAFVETDVSHPSSLPVAGMVQFAKPSVQLEVHTPPEHAFAATFVPEHARPHAPQFAGSPESDASQPFATCPSQSANPDAHAAIEQTPPEHFADAFAGLHALPHPPQFARSELVLASQPFAGWPSQSENPAEQVKPHVPALHVAVAFGRDGHALPHDPQCCGSFAATSHPFDACPSQSKNPGLHVNPHEPAAHVGIVFGKVGQAKPQAPQSSGSELVAISQPSAA
jgi:hypothetical protein